MFSIRKVAVFGLGLISSVSLAAIMNLAVFAADRQVDGGKMPITEFKQRFDQFANEITGTTVLTQQVRYFENRKVVLHSSEKAKWALGINGMGCHQNGEPQGLSLNVDGVISDLSSTPSECAVFIKVEGQNVTVISGKNGKYADGESVNMMFAVAKTNVMMPTQPITPTQPVTPTNPVTSTTPVTPTTQPHLEVLIGVAGCATTDLSPTDEPIKPAFDPCGTLMPQEAVGIYVNILNSGAITGSTAVTLTTPDSWAVSGELQWVSNLGPNMMDQHNVQLLIPSDVLEGDYAVTASLADGSSATVVLYVINGMPTNPLSKHLYLPLVAR